MTPQERDVIAGIFDRLRQVANQPRDPEAERFIADRLREQPYAVYAMAQSIYVQEQALANQQAQLEQARAEIEELRRQSPPAAPAEQSGGFLSGGQRKGKTVRVERSGARPREVETPRASTTSYFDFGAARLRSGRTDF